MTDNSTAAPRACRTTGQSLAGDAKRVPFGGMTSSRTVCLPAGEETERTKYEVISRPGFVIVEFLAKS